VRGPTGLLDLGVCGPLILLGAVGIGVEVRLVGAGIFRARIFRARIFSAIGRIRTGTVAIVAILIGPIAAPTSGATGMGAVRRSLVGSILKALGTFSNTAIVIAAIAIDIAPK
jgi:hypothetical protein